MKKIFIGAGETSSDKIAAQIIKALPSDIELNGITGVEMEKLGVKSIFNIKDIAFIGLDILTNLGTIVKRINQTVNWIEQNKPEVAIFVDAYDFYIRVAKKLKAKNCSTKIIAVVAPLAWLYSHNKVYNLNKYFDKLICIFPFEPEFFAKNGHPNVHFFGNPFLQKINDEKMARDKNLILIAVGSRKQEIIRHIPLIKQVIQNIRKINPTINIFMPTTLITHEYVVKEFNKIKNIEFSSNEQIKDLKMRTAYFGIAKSGTNNMEMSARGMPLLIYYKIDIFSYLIGRFLLKIRMINMVNIVAKKMIIPEIIQYKNNARQISECFFDFYNNDSKVYLQINEVTSQITKIKGINIEDFGTLCVNEVLSQK